jgi:flagellar motor protein MotB
MANNKGLIWAIAIAVLSFAGASGVVYYAWNLRGDHAAATDELEKVRWDSQACTKELGEQKTASSGLTERAASCETARDEDKKDRKSIEDSLTQMEANLSATREELDDLRKRKKEIEKRVAEFNALTEKFEQMIDAKQVEVSERNGYMYISLPASGLFDSGTAELSKKGQLEFMEVAVILKQKRFGARRFMVVGHTDKRRAKSSKFANNWELASARAIKVTQFMVEAGMKPQNLLPAAQAQFDPVGKKPAHQIEIVLLPDPSETPPLPDDPKPDEPAEAPADPKTP